MHGQISSVNHRERSDAAAQEPGFPHFGCRRAASAFAKSTQKENVRGTKYLNGSEVMSLGIPRTTWTDGLQRRPIRQVSDVVATTASASSVAGDPVGDYRLVGKSGQNVFRSSTRTRRRDAAQCRGQVDSMASGRPVIVVADAMRTVEFWKWG